MPSRDVANLQKRFAALPAKMRKAVRPTVDKVANEMVGIARRFAPVEDGTLRASIKTRSGPHELAEEVIAGGPTTTRPVRNGASATYDYALSQEYGSSRNAASPFFWPAYRLIRKSARNRIRSAVRKAVKEF